MSSAKERLGQLLAMAGERHWAPLAHELAVIMLAWPPDFPQAMRAPVVALFETALRESDTDTQSELAAQLCGRADIPLRLLNALYLAASPAQRREILMRNELEGAPSAPLPVDAGAVLAAARSKSGDFTGTVGRLTGVARPLVVAVLGDVSGEPLAVLCRGAGLDRAVFSAIALLRAPLGLPLAVFDTVAPKAAAALVADWRRSAEHIAPESIRAAE